MNLNPCSSKTRSTRDESAAIGSDAMSFQVCFALSNTCDCLSSDNLLKVNAKYPMPTVVLIQNLRQSDLDVMDLSYSRTAVETHAHTCTGISLCPSMRMPCKRRPASCPLYFPASRDVSITP